MAPRLKKLGITLPKHRPATPLPPGFDPKIAGKLALWLLGRREHVRSLKRVATPPAYRIRTLADKARYHLWPWTVWNYGGWHRCFAHVLGVAPDYARQIASGVAALPAKHAVRLAAVVGDHGRASLEIEAELLAYARERERTHNERDQLARARAAQEARRRAKHEAAEAVRRGAEAAEIMRDMSGLREN